MWILLICLQFVSSNSQVVNILQACRNRLGRNEHIDISIQNKRYGLTTFIITAELISLQYSLLPLTQPITNTWRHLQRYYLTLSQSRLVHVGSDSVSSKAKYNTINKVLPVQWVPPTDLWGGDRLQTGAEPSDNRYLKDCCGVNHLFSNRITGATVGLHWHGPSNVEGSRHVLGTSTTAPGYCRSW
jgi:hypothetical protein